MTNIGVDTGVELFDRSLGRCRSGPDLSEFGVDPMSNFSIGGGGRSIENLNIDIPSVICFTWTTPMGGVRAAGDRRHACGSSLLNLKFSNPDRQSRSHMRIIDADYRRRYRSPRSTGSATGSDRIDPEIDRIDRRIGQDRSKDRLLARSQKRMTASLLDSIGPDRDQDRLRIGQDRTGSASRSHRSTTPIDTIDRIELD